MTPTRALLSAAALVRGSSVPEAERIAEVLISLAREMLPPLRYDLDSGRFVPMEVKERG